MSNFILLIVPVMAAFIAAPILIYHFLFFPNLNGVMMDIEWYIYDNESQHYLYWFGFYASGVLGGILGASMRSTK